MRCVPASSIITFLLNANKVDIRTPGKGNLHSHGARPACENHLDDSVDSDQEVVKRDRAAAPCGVCQPQTLPLNPHLTPQSSETPPSYAKQCIDQLILESQLPHKTVNVIFYLV